VDRPGLEVRSRSGYFAAKPGKGKAPKTPPLSALDEAIARGLPRGDMPLRVSAAAFAVPGKKEAEVAVVVGIRERANAGLSPGPALGGAGGTRRINVIATAFDASWTTKGAFTQTLELTLRPTPAAEQQYEVLSRLPMRPGRYEVRFAAESAGRAGSVFVDLDVPDFAKDGLSLSGLVLERTPALPMASRTVLAGVLPIVPTTVRDFGRTDRVAAFVRVYQGGKHALIAPTIWTRIVDDGNRTVYEKSTPLSAASFSRDRAADYRLDLPIAQLPPGKHLLTIELDVGTRMLRRDARFTVR
jgi:hypothetical protein